MLKCLKKLLQQLVNIIFSEPMQSAVSDIVFDDKP